MQATFQGDEEAVGAWLGHPMKRATASVNAQAGAMGSSQGERGPSGRRADLTTVGQVMAAAPWVG